MNKPVYPMNSNDSKILSLEKLQYLLSQMDKEFTIDLGVDQMMKEFLDEFINKMIKESSELARHRQSSQLEVKDIKLYLERQWGLKVPGYEDETLNHVNFRKLPNDHKRRLGLVKADVRKVEKQQQKLLKRR